MPSNYKTHVNTFYYNNNLNCLKAIYKSIQGFPGDTVVKNPPANARDTRDAGSIPGLGRFPRVENGTPSCIIAWKLPWTEDPGRLQTRCLQTWQVAELELSNQAQA